MHTLQFGVPRTDCHHSQVRQAAVSMLHIQHDPPRLRSCTSPPQLLCLAARGQGHHCGFWTHKGWHCPGCLWHSSTASTPSSAKEVSGTESPGWAQALLSWLPTSWHRHQNCRQDGLEVTARPAAHQEGEEEGMFGTKNYLRCFYFWFTTVKWLY